MKRVLLIFLGIALRARCTQLDVITGADALVPESTNTLKEVHRHSFCYTSCLSFLVLRCVHAESVCCRALLWSNLVVEL